MTLKKTNHCPSQSENLSNFSMDIIKTYTSKHYNDRPTGDDGIINTIVLHYTDTRDLEETFDIFLRSDREVSAHYVLDTNGDIYNLVDPKFRAYHAGVSSWKGRSNVNHYSIGIEIQNGGHNHLQEEDFLPEFPDIQIQNLLKLLDYLCPKYDIPRANIIGHSDIAPERKLDPGEHFPWETLGEAGFGVWPKPEVNFDNILLLQYQLKALGYSIKTDGQMDDHTWCVVDSFKRHFYPKLL